MIKVILVVNNIRSTYNVGSLLRTADGFGVEHVYLTGYTPYPPSENDSRLPHEQKKLQDQIHKTALGAEKTQSWSYEPEALNVIKKCRSKGYSIVSLEQTEDSIDLDEFKPPERLALVIGNEISGVSNHLISSSDKVLQIPMKGAKESFNVTVATAVTLYHMMFAVRQK